MAHESYRQLKSHHSQLVSKVNGEPCSGLLCSGVAQKQLENDGFRAIYFNDVGRTIFVTTPLLPQ